ncbi:MULTISPECIES: DUF2179 domain-containing protein [Bacillaceae]|uniref:DUF2179 domain-containing protein n=1 Tax=Bacillaceae TaxID=186817 RepID=UPI000BFB4C7B|nr:MULTISPECIES: DUF2179 domain-containing protein [Bacillaceae]PGT78091.1 hypothetical protein COD11_24225 [Bacillus sp. AFS040349]UGB32837.1 DUF2179 domain-containing protein [Metabacillus sp. B2-18]
MLLQALLIFVLQLIYVPVLTIRTILLVKNQTKSAAGVGLLEGIIYIVSLIFVFQDLSNMYNIVAYVVGFSVGLLLGGALERKLAIGYITYQANILDKNMELVNALRTAGFGVTVFEGEGINTARFRLDIVAKRSREKELLHIIDQHEPKAFLMSYEIRSFKGGFLTKSMKKRAVTFLKKKHAQEEK